LRRIAAEVGKRRLQTYGRLIRQAKGSRRGDGVGKKGALFAADEYPRDCLSQAVGGVFEVRLADGGEGKPALFRVGGFEPVGQQILNRRRAGHFGELVDSSLSDRRWSSLSRKVDRS